MISWVIITSIVILLSNVLNGLLGGIDESLLVDGIRHICVKVVLIVFDMIHVFVNCVISSNSWEAESFIVKFPGVNLWRLLSNFTSNLLSVVKIGNVKVS